MANPSSVASAVGLFDLFKIGVGPSSSHTVGPMRAATTFVETLQTRGSFDSVAEIQIDLFGSLAATGGGHRTPDAIISGLEGVEPDSAAAGNLAARAAEVQASGQLRLAGNRHINFDVATAFRYRPLTFLPRHSNAMHLRALTVGGETLHEETYYSVGGGTVVTGDSESASSIASEGPHTFRDMRELLAVCAARGLSIADAALENERSRSQNVAERLLIIHDVMTACIERGLSTEGVLPGGLEVPRRAAALARELTDPSTDSNGQWEEWVSAVAMAVNEENAAGGRVVTAPTNGAAGIVPAVMYYTERFVKPGVSVKSWVPGFLATAGAVGALCKTNASISGAEVGCQGEVGSAAAMAAAGLTAVLGGTPGQVENAAEIALEHCLGLTCDPIGGLVQIPCIERNAMGAIKAIIASKLALRGNGTHHVSLDQAIATMRATGLDMHTKYKETSAGGLAVAFVEC